MTKSARKRLSILLSLFLTAFLLCQGMAKAALPPAMPGGMAMAGEMGCQMGAMDRGTPTVKDTHAMDCQHLDKAWSPEYQAAFGDHAPLVMMCLMPVLQGDAGSPISFAALPWHDPPGDPPIPIRLQRFLK